MPVNLAIAGRVEAVDRLQKVMAMCSALTTPRFQIRFESLFNAGRALIFPCDAQGHVALDELSDSARHNYLYARAVVGREFAAPTVLRVERP